MNRTAEPAVLPSSITGLDGLTGGLRTSAVTVLLGADERLTGDLSLTLARSLAVADVPTRYITWRTDADHTQARATAAHCGLPLRCVRDGACADEIERLEHAEAELTNLAVSPVPDDIAELAIDSESWALRHPDGPTALVLHGPNGLITDLAHDSIDTALAHEAAAQMLCTLAVRDDIAVILTLPAQPGPWPLTLDHLPPAWAQTATTVIAAEPLHPSRGGVTKLRVLKSADGRTGDVYATHEPHKGRFRP